MRHYVRYFIVGVITTLISWISFKLLRVYIPMINENVANVFSILLAIVCSYFMNRLYVFDSKDKNIVKEFGSFFGGRIVTAVIEELYFFVMVTLLLFNEMFIKITASAIAMVLNYLVSRFFVFKKVNKDDEKIEVSK